MATTLVEERPTPASVWSTTRQAGPAARWDAQGFSFPGRAGGLAIGPDGVVFISDTVSGTIWRLAEHETLPVATPLVGSAAGLRRHVLTPAGMALGPDGSLFIADATGHRVWALSPSGDLRVVAGSVNGHRDGSAREALFRFPSDLAVGPDGTCYVADTGNDCIRTISPQGQVATLAGSNYAYGNGRGPAARFRRPAALDVDGAGTCYVADSGNNAIRRIDPDGKVTTLAGSPPGGHADGVGAEVGLRWPSGLALGHEGDLWVADQGNGALRRIDPVGASTTHLVLTGHRWPVAVALRPNGEVVVAATLLDDDLRPHARLISGPGAGATISLVLGQWPF